jgi:leucyl aminopeptidase
MDFGVHAGSLAKHRTGCIVVGVYARKKLSPPAMALDTGLRRTIDEVLERGDLDGKLGATLLLQNVPNASTERVLLVGLGRASEFGEDNYVEALASAVTALQSTRSAEATICLNELAVKGRDGAWKIEQALLAVMAGMYRFDKLKSKPPIAKRPLRKVVFHLPDRAEISSAKVAIERGMAIAEGMALARDLGNLPGNICTPTYLAERARELGERDALNVKILDEEDLVKLRMGAFLAVSRGSRQPPKLIVMEYQGGPRGTKPVVLVGKGITFDTGGISIKPARELDEMKFDMCGAASVFGALRAAALMKLPLNVIGVIPAAENMPGGNAMKPGDIVTTMAGKTVEILDTDHEGRLVLCDALTYVERYKPAAVIDIATLTDSIVIALGDVATGLLSNDEALAREILQAGDRAWDRAWQLPLWDAYQGKLESNFADFPNVGDGAGAITAACFLSRFVKGTAWAHLDIAGTASKSGDEKGATGRPVALLAHFLAGRAPGGR